MAIYTVRNNQTDEIIDFEWHLDTDPTDVDMEEVFAAAAEIKTVTPAPPTIPKPEPSPYEMAPEPAIAETKRISPEYEEPSEPNIFQRFKAGVVELMAGIPGLAAAAAAPIPEEQIPEYLRGQEIAEKIKKGESLEPRPEDEPEQWRAYQTYIARGPGAVEHRQKTDFLREIERQMLVDIPKDIEKQREKDRQYIASKEAWKPSNWGKTAEAVLRSTADQLPNVMATMVTPPVGMMLMARREATGWEKQARGYGIEDEDVLKEGMVLYSIPAGIVETASSMILGAPYKALMKTPAGKGVAKAVSKNLLGKILSKIAATLTGAAAEGAEEVIQDYVSEGVMLWALRRAEERNPERAEEYRTQAAKIYNSLLSKEGISDKAKTFLQASLTGLVIGAPGQAMVAAREMEAPARPEVPPTKPTPPEAPPVAPEAVPVIPPTEPQIEPESFWQMEEEERQKTWETLSEEQQDAVLKAAPAEEVEKPADLARPETVPEPAAKPPTPAPVKLAAEIAMETIPEKKVKKPAPKEVAPIEKVETYKTAKDIPVEDIRKATKAAITEEMAQRISILFDKEITNEKGEKFRLDPETAGAAFYVSDGKPVMVLHPDLSANELANTLFHETGHYGERIIFNVMPEMWQRINKHFQVAEKGAAIKRLCKIYAKDLKNKSEAEQRRILMSEWTANHLGAYFEARDKKSPIKKIQEDIYRIWREALIAFGISEERIDDVIRAMARKLRTVREPTLPLAAPIAEEVVPVFQRKEKPPTKESEYISWKTLEEEYRSIYYKEGKSIASSREKPAKMQDIPVGAWRIDDFVGLHGREIAQMRMVDPNKLIDVEQPEIYRKEDVDKYEQWRKEGMLPPPIEVVKTYKGELKITNGHRRAAAAKRLGLLVPAWVSPLADHPQGRKDSEGKLMQVGMTFEMAQAGFIPAFQRKEKKPPPLPERPIEERKEIARKKVAEKYSNIPEIEREAQRLRGKMMRISREDLAERAKIQVDIDRYTTDRDRLVRNAIWDYARKIKLPRYHWNRVDTLLKNTRTVAGLKKALNIMDDVLQRREHNVLYNKVLEKIAREKTRIKGEQGKKKGTQVIETNNALLELFEQLEAPEQIMTEAIEKELAEIIENPEKDPQKARDIIKKAFRKSIKGMTIQELQGVLTTINQIKKFGRQKWQQQKEERQSKLAKQAELTVESVGKAPYVHPLRKAVEGPKQPNILERAFWAHIRPERIARWFTRWKKGPVYQNTFAKILNAENKKLENVKRSINEFNKIHEDINIYDAITKELMTIIIQDDEGKHNIPLTLNNMMQIYAHSQNPGGLAHLEGTGITEEIITEVTSNLPTEAINAVNAMIDYYDDTQWYRLNDVFEREHQVRMPKEHRYMPISNIESSRAENAILADLMARMSARNNSIQKGFTKSRIHSKSAFKELDYFRSVVDNLLKVEHYIAYADAVRDVNAYLNNADIKSVMEKKNKAAYQELQDWVGSVAYGKVRRAEGIVDRVSEFLRTNYVTAVLGFNIVTMMKQPASFSQGIAQINKKHVVVAGSKFIQNPKEMIRFVKSKSIMMENREDSFERELAEMAEKRALKSAIGEIRGAEKIKKISMKPIQAADMMTTSILWYAKYQESLSRGRSEQAAINNADEVIRTTQPMGGIIHMPSAYRGGGLQRAFYMFTNQLNQNANLLFEMADRWGETKTVDNLAKIAFYGIVPSMIIYMASAGGRPPWEDPEGWAATFVSNFFGGIPFFGEFIELGIRRVGDITRITRGGKPSSYRYSRMLSDLTPTSLAAIEDAYNVMKARDPRRAADMLAQITAKILGIPYTQMRRTSIGIKKIVEAWTKEGDIGDKTKALRLLIWSESAIKDPSIYADILSVAKKTTMRADEAAMLVKWWDGASDKEKEKIRRDTKREIGEKYIVGKQIIKARKTIVDWKKKYAKKQIELEKALIKKEITKEQRDERLKKYKEINRLVNIYKDSK